MGDLCLDFIEPIEGRAGQLHLSARLQGDLEGRARERDVAAVLLDGRPAARGEPLEHRGDAALSLVRQGFAALRQEADLLVLGADAPAGSWLGTLDEDLAELARMLDQRR